MAESKMLAVSQCDFAFSLYKHVHLLEENTVFCPLSILATLMMIGTGARGSTATELEEVLKLTSIASTSEDHSRFCELVSLVLKTQSDDLQLTVSNAAFFQDGQTVNEDFGEALLSHYNAPVSFVDYKQSSEACSTINGWIEQQTSNKIKNMLSPSLFDEYTKLVLVNAVYMKGLWLNPFESAKTEEATFHLLDSTKKTVNLMYQKAKLKLSWSERLSCKMLELPYKGEEFAMYIVLPDSVDGLVALEKSISRADIEELSEGLHSVSVHVWLPRFKAETSVLALEKIMPSVGIDALFKEDKADLSGISSTHDLFVSSLLHKAVIEVDEKGCEAAAATVAVVRMTRSLPMSEQFRADHPFLYFIRHNPSSTIMFIGRLTSPVTSCASKDEL